MMDNNNIRNDDLTLKDLILLVKEYFLDVRKNWIIVLLICLLFSIVFAFLYSRTLPSYRAETKFYLESEGGGLSGLGGLLGQIGIKKRGVDNPYQILEVAQSRIMLSKVLFHKADSQDDFLINQILDSYKLLDKMAKRNPQFANFKFNHSTIDSFSNTERRVLISVQNLILKGNSDYNALRSINFDEDNGFFEIKLNTISEKISLNLANYTYDFLKDHYEQKTINDLVKTRDILKVKSDSIKETLTTKMYALNRFGDRSQQLLSKEVRTKSDLLEKEISALALVQGELMRQMELTNFSIQTSKEKFILIDRPFEPIYPIRPELYIELIKGILMGFVFATLFLIGRKLINDSLK